MNLLKKPFVLPLFLGLLTIGFSLQALSTNRKVTVDVSTASISAQNKRVDAIIADMSVRDKIGQMIMCDIIGKRVDPKLQAFLDDIRPGGITLFNYNIQSPEQLRRLNRDLLSKTKPIAPFLTIDQEGGEVTRLHEDISDFPGNMALGATRSVDLSEQVGRTLGEGLAAYGFNMNLAPVLDVNTNPKNPIIGTRSFSSDPKLVGRLGAAYIKGLQARGVLAAGKHFPGHGDAAGDSHMSLPILKYDGQKLRNRELVPFRQAISDGQLSVIMTAHISLPGLHSGSHVPATLSKPVLTDILRQEIGFKGIILTDGLEMRGLLGATGTIAAASVKAVQAGADMVSVNAAPEDVREARDAIEDAVKQGLIPIARVEESVRRILRIKVHHGILDNHSHIAAPSRAQKQHYLKTAREVSIRSATLVKNEANILPITSGKYKRVLVIGPRAFVDRLESFSSGIKLDKIVYQENKRRVRDVKHALKRLKHKPDVIVAALFEDEDMVMAKTAVRKFNSPVAVVALGSPYMLLRYQQAEAFLCLFSYRSAAVIVAADIVVGRQSPSGHLPVPIPGLYPYGHSLHYTQLAKPHPNEAPLVSANQ